MFTNVYGSSQAKHYVEFVQLGQFAGQARHCDDEVLI